MTWEIDNLPAGAVIEEITVDGYTVRLPDGSFKHVSIVPDALAGFKVVKTVFPADCKVTVSVGDARDLQKPDHTE